MVFKELGKAIQVVFFIHLKLSLFIGKQDVTLFVEFPHYSRPFVKVVIVATDLVSKIWQNLFIGFEVVLTVYLASREGIVAAKLKLLVSLQ